MVRSNAITKAQKKQFVAEAGVGARRSQRTWDNGVIVPCFAIGVIGLAPALGCSEDETDLMLDRVEKSLDQLLEAAKIRSLLR